MNRMSHPSSAATALHLVALHRTVSHTMEGISAACFLLAICTYPFTGCPVSAVAVSVYETRCSTSCLRHVREGINAALESQDLPGGVGKR